ncbi:polysaccharide deacetylase family protein [Aromatoleum toluolicum]|uniref:Polysaccharide deacetylase family protein n=1 Tax=Aromatoleum toluolicum TaxID=90060 RepID=A0ABX1NBX8_9RHOO|nr:polysaccharide deacetylase family protein [Aromatoleum toluolicum]NMF96728.1 polysaccharide deacetylase family protein [Aromatoleum toluolicum]
MKPDPISVLLHRNAGEHGPVMLAYHSVQSGKESPMWPWAVSLHRFVEQVDFLVAQGYRVITMADLAMGKFDHGERTVAITFDDGYVDNLQAYQALLERGLRATWLVVTGAFGATPNWPGDGRPAGRLLSVAELRDMHAAGMEIGSHTVHHARLPALDDNALALELQDSRAALEDALGLAVTSFAYPYGAWDMRCAGAVRAAGYLAACTTRTGWALRDGNPFTLRRLTIFNHDTAGTLARKLYFGSHEVGWSDIARYALRRLRG